MPVTGPNPLIGPIPQEALREMYKLFAAPAPAYVPPPGDPDHQAAVAASPMPEAEPTTPVEEPIEDVPAPQPAPPVLEPLPEPGEEAARVHRIRGKVVDQTVQLPPTDYTEQPPLEEPAPAPPVEPAEEPPKEKGALEEWEASWMEQYNLTPQELIGEDLYDKLVKASEKKMSLGEIIGIVGVMATNPEAGRAMIARYEGDKKEALGALINLQSEVTKFKRAGLAEYAKGKRQEAREEAYMNRIMARAELESREARAKFSADFMEETAREGLPSGTVRPPSVAEINDPAQFQAWLADASNKISQHIGKDKMYQWLMDPKGGPSWLAAQHAIDPSEGVMTVFEDSGYFSPEELATIRETLLPQYTARAQMALTREQADIAKTHADTDRVRQQTHQAYEMTQNIIKKRELMGEMTPGQRSRLLRDVAFTMGKLQEMQSKMLYYADFLRDKDEDAYSDTIRKNLQGVQDLDIEILKLQREMMDLQQDTLTGYMDRAQALPLAIEGAITQTMEMHGASFDGDENAAKAVFFSDYDDPEFRSERRAFFINLLINFREMTGGTWQDAWNDITIGAAGASPLDVEAGRDVVEPGGIPHLAEQFYRQLGTSPTTEETVNAPAQANP